MNPPPRSLSPSQAAAHLGVTAKALRLYEQRGLLEPDRTSAGWRAYRPADMARAAEIVSLRALGLSLTQIAGLIDGKPGEVTAGLAAHESLLRVRAEQIAAALEKLQALQSGRIDRQAPTADGSDHDSARHARPAVGFELPWPWGGEWFELRDMGSLNFITGPLGSGKTRFAERLAERLPDAEFLGLNRQIDGAIPRPPAGDTTFAERVEQSLTRLAEDGAERSNALLALVCALEASSPSILIVDMVEQGLSGAAQEALMAYLRSKAWRKRTLFLMTRSASILDIDAVGAAEAVILCPANHSPPIRVVPRPGGRGYESVATCLAAPAVRARTAGTVASRPAIA